MEKMILPVEFMKIGFTIAVPLLFLYIVLSFVKNDVVKCTMCFCKAAAYFGLAYFMWKFYCDKEHIDIVSAFTFIFCCFEAADNVITILSIPIEYVRKRIEDKREYEMKKLELESMRRR